MKGATPMRKSRSGIPAGDDVVFIGGIPRGATQGELREYFRALVGCVAKVRFVIDHSTRHHKGYGFARFGNGDVAKKVVELSKKGLLFKGKLLNVGPSAEDRHGETSSTGGSDTTSSTLELSEPFVPTLPAAQQVATAPIQPLIYAAQPQQFVFLQQVPVQPQYQLVYVQSVPQQMF